MTAEQPSPEPVEQPVEVPEVPVEHAAWVAHECTGSCGPVCKW